jgi:hypothetical protein
MKASFLAMFGLLALANAAPQYGHNNYFTGSKKPLRGSYSNCKVEWRTVNKAGYKEVTEYKEKTIYQLLCKDFYQTECKNIKVCTQLLTLLMSLLISSFFPSVFQEVLPHKS